MLTFTKSKEVSVKVTDTNHESCGHKPSRKCGDLDDCSKVCDKSTTYPFVLL